MLKLKDESGNDKPIVPLNKGISNIPLPKPNEIPNIGNKIKITIVVDGLPEGSTDQDAINAAIKDFNTAGVIDPNKVSNGVNTFRELYDIIAERDKHIRDLQQLIYNYEQTK